LSQSSKDLRTFETILKYQVPPFLFHYTSAAGLQGIIDSSSIWASMIQFLNDTQELQGAISLCQSLLRRRRDKYEDVHERELLELLAASLNRVATVNICVCSFSAQPDLLSQWRGYCPPEGGYCIGFVGQMLIDSFKSHKFTVLPCVYDENTKKALLEDVLDFTVPELIAKRRRPTYLSSELLVEGALESFFRLFYEVAPIIKDSGFAEEKEWRAVSAPIPATDPRISYRPQGGLLKPYYELPLNLRDQPFPIIAGPTPHKDLALKSLVTVVAKNQLPATPQPSRIPFRNL